MNERLLQFIWQFQHYNKDGLELTNGETLQVVFPGQLNKNQGPDFLEARIRIGNTLWSGSIELHVHSSDWNKHAHQLDPNYDNVILHVVWQEDQDIQSRFLIPVLSLEEKVPKFLLQQYETWMNSMSFIPCEKSFRTIPDIIWIGWKEKLVIERLERRSIMISHFLQQNNHHWEETFWWLLARNFGIVVNAESFEMIARSLPIAILAKHKNQIHQLEAMLLGQGGLLKQVFNEDYPRMLQKEYQFLKRKYHFMPIHQAVLFLRMRPVNFPTIRLAQLAMLVRESSHLFSRIKEVISVKDMRKLVNVTANDYWHYHYTFDDTSSFKPKIVGKVMTENILINTVIPVLYAYGYLNNEDKWKQKALNWIEEIAVEKNPVTMNFSKLGISGENAFDSQALIELKTKYCDEKKCLECAVGNALLNPG